MLQYDIINDLQTEPVTTSFFQKHANIDFDTDLELMDSYLKAARQELEAWSQLSFGVKTISLKATDLPDNFPLMHGRVDTIITDGYENFGDTLLTGGKNVSIEYTTKGLMNETIKVAICRYAAGLYAIREHIASDAKGNPVGGVGLLNEAKEMIRPIRNVTIF